jgi:MerR family transcriptional regulator/heat shock protein HspR
MATRPRELAAQRRPRRIDERGHGARSPERAMTSLRDPHRPRYFISIAAELASVHPRTLRIYEEEGLLCPQRRNNLRLYSEADIQRVRIIRFLTRRQGVNLAGVKVILQLEALGKIRVYDLFDADDVERFIEEGESVAEATAPLDGRTEGQA